MTRRKIAITAAIMSLMAVTPVFAYTDTLGEREAAKELYEGFIENQGDYSNTGYGPEIGMHLHNFLTLDYFPCEDIIIEYRWDTDSQSQTIGIVADDSQEVLKKLTEYSSKVEEIVRSIPEDVDTDREKAIYLNNRLIDICEYDESYNDSSEKTNAYEALVKGKSVCEGYAKAYYSLCTAANIPCRLVVGFSGDTTDARGTKVPDHEYNSVFIDGEWLYIDTTWNDIGNTKNDWLLIDKETFSKSHKDVLFYENVLESTKVVN